MKRPVLDSYAILVFLFAQEGSDRIQDLLEQLADSGGTALIASPNWAEVRYVVERKVGSVRWPEVRDKLVGLPIEIVSVDQDLAEAAGSIKAKHRMSLADAFATALALQRKSEIYTGDPEFKAVEKEIKVMWL